MPSLIFPWYDSMFLSNESAASQSSPEKELNMSGYLYYDGSNKDPFSTKHKYIIPLTNKNYTNTSRSRTWASNINTTLYKEILPVKNP